jgi:drug/metabolite transporter (DMT)-like permease
VVITLAAVGVLVNLLNGNTTGTVWFAVLTLVGVWLLLRPRLRRQQRTVNIWSPLAVAAVFLVAGIVATTAAGQNADQRLGLVSFAILLYACSGMGVFLAVIVHRYQHRLPPTTDENELQ